MRGLLWSLLWLPALAWAEPLTVSVDRDQMQVGETLRLTIQSRTKGAAASNLQSPSLADWQIVGQFEHTTFDGRRGERARTLNLSLQPLKTGQIVIDSFVLQTAQGPVKSQPITVTVGGKAPAAVNPTNPAPNAGQAAPDGAAPDRAAFVRWEIENKGPLWLGEQLEARLVFYYNLKIRLRGAEMGEVKLKGFWTHDRKSSSGRRRVQIGEDIFVRETLVHYQLIPLRAGNVELPKVAIEMTVDQSRGFQRKRVKATRESEPVAITVKPLPSKGRPADFRGSAVGAVKLQAAADRTRIKGDQGVQFTVITTVDGLLQNVPPVELPDIDGFRVFPPSNNENVRLFNEALRGTRRQTWLMRPTRDGTLTIPSMSLPYFDPKAGRYRVARTRKLTVQASGVKATQAKAGQGARVTDREALALRTIRKTVSAHSADTPVYTRAWFLIGFAAPPIAFAALLLVGRARRRRDATAGSRSAKRAANVAQARLDAVARGKEATPYAAVSHALIGYLEARLGQPVKGLTHPELERLLQSRGATATQTRELVTELENCDFARFAPSQGGGGVDECVARSKALVSGLEKALS